MRIALPVTVPVALLVGAGLGGCKAAEKPAAAPAEAGPRTVHVTATEYSFQAPDTLPSGLTSFHLMNQGKEPHHLTIIKLAEGMTAADLGKVDPTGPMPPGLVLVGGPNAAGPGATAEAVVDLQPGNYMMMCFIPSFDGKPHFTKGMARPLTVVTGETAPKAPTADVTIKLTDYAFEASPALSGGHHVIRIENVATQPHELVLVKLEAGKTVQQMAEWAEKMQGPPPGNMLGSGAAPMSSGQAVYVTVDLTPGEYGLLCFLPDAKDGKPHVMHGMLQQITIM